MRLMFKHFDLAKKVGSGAFFCSKASGNGLLTIEIIDANSEGHLVPAIVKGGVYERLVTAPKWTSSNLPFANDRFALLKKPFSQENQLPRLNDFASSFRDWCPN
jgi:hypothetical protein